MIEQKKCEICGTQNPFYGWTGYVYYQDGKQRYAGWCKQHEKQFERSANPVFENQAALDIFKSRHPKLYNRDVRGKSVIFLVNDKYKEIMK